MYVQNFKLMNKISKKTNNWTSTLETYFLTVMGGSREGTGGPDPTLPPGKSEVAIGFLRNTGTNSHREEIGPRGVQLLLEGCSCPL